MAVNGLFHLTWHARDAEDVSVADVELVDQRARLVGVDDDYLAGRVGAGEDPHSTVHAVCLLEFLRLKERWINQKQRLT